MSSSSAASVLRRAIAGHRGRPSVWRDATPRESYDVILVGAGAHALATAFHLARDHGVTGVAVLDTSRPGDDGAARPAPPRTLTTEEIAFRRHAMARWRRLGRDLPGSAGMAPCDAVLLAHTHAQAHRLARFGNALRLNGLEAAILEGVTLHDRLPLLESETAVVAGLRLPRAITTQPDGIARAYAQAAAALGVDIVPNATVTALNLGPNGAVAGVETARGPIKATRVGLCGGGPTRALAASADVSLPLSPCGTRTLVCEPVTACLNALVWSEALACAVTQADTGEVILTGAAPHDPDTGPSEDTPTPEQVCAAVVGLFPALSRLHVMRTWTGTEDTTPDGRPILDTTPVSGLSVSVGWSGGDAWAVPAAGEAFAHTIAKGSRHPLARPFALGRGVAPAEIPAPPVPA